VHGHHASRVPVPPPCRAGDQNVPAAQAEGADDPGGSVTAIADLLSDQDRARLLARLRHLEQLAELVREVPEQRPPEVPPALADRPARTVPATTKG
jgi:hypothetical protein